MKEETLKEYENKRGRSEDTLYKLERGARGSEYEISAEDI